MSTGDEVIEMTAISELDADSFSKELEAQTGFSSYEAFLRASGRNKRSDGEFLESWQYLRNGDSYTTSHCSIMDLPKENSAKGLTVRLNQSVSKDPEDPPYATALALIKDLRSPVDNGSVRIVTWYTENAGLISEWVDVIGVGMLLRANLEQDVSSTRGDQDLSYSSLLPFFRIASINVQSMHDSVERSLSKLYDENDISDKGVRDEASRRSRNETYNSLDQERYQLRRAIEECENDHQFFVDYVASNGNEDWLERRSYRTTAAYSEFTTRVAKRLEAEVRDYMQLVVGVLSIEESRESIQLSNTQLNEGKKVKIFTILAFIYVPLNLATSIFGMNLQQLNAEGQPVWVFVLTATVATILTASVWFCIDQSNSIRSWIRLQETATSMDYDYDNGSPNYSIGVRLTMIGALVHWGYTKWMFRYKTWFHILQNSERLFWDRREYSYQALAAGHLVTGYLRLQYRDDFNLEGFR
ncbi:MAG: hypothetical protein Q9207_007327 [Kuettlingeria erythrocarpa]